MTVGKNDHDSWAMIINSGDGRKEPSKLKPDVVDINLTSWVGAWSVHMCCTCTEEADVKRYVPYTV